MPLLAFPVRPPRGGQAWLGILIKLFRGLILERHLHCCFEEIGIRPARLVLPHGERMLNYCLDSKVIPAEGVSSNESLGHACSGRSYALTGQHILYETSLDSSQRIHFACVFNGVLITFHKAQFMYTSSSSKSPFAFSNFKILWKFTQSFQMVLL